MAGINGVQGMHVVDLESDLVLAAEISRRTRGLTRGRCGQRLEAQFHVHEAGGAIRGGGESRIRVIRRAPWALRWH